MKKIKIYLYSSGINLIEKENSKNMFPFEIIIKKKYKGELKT